MDTRFPILACATPPAWVDSALERLPELLLDHANCEKKAASTAVSLLFRYPQHDVLARRMARLAREELRHFEQVQGLLRAREIPFRRVPASRYAFGLRQPVRAVDPGRLVDILVAGAFIEARSCERFSLLAPRLDAVLGDFYEGLVRAEARHYSQYLELAASFAGDSLDERIEVFALAEQALVTDPDPTFGFHSGPPP